MYCFFLWLPKKFVYLVILLVVLKNCSVFHIVIVNIEVLH